MYCRIYINKTNPTNSKCQKVRFLMKKNIGLVIGIIMAVLAGIFFAIFGVFLSIFADITYDIELFVRIGIVLFIYIILGALWGFLLPVFSWKWGLLLGGPGSLVLILIILSGFLSDTKFDYTALVGIIYAVMVLLIPSLTARGISSIRNKRKNQ